MAEKKYLDKNGLLYVWGKIKTITDGKVDKEEGKGLSSNDLTDDLLEKIEQAGSSSFSGAYTDLTGKPTINGHELGATNTLEELGIQEAGDYATKTEVSGKVDKVTGKGLSTKDYTAADQSKLAGIEAGAQVNTISSIKRNSIALVPSSDKSVDIKVPEKISELTNDSDFVEDGTYVHTDNNYTTAEKSKLAGIGAGAQANVIEKIQKNGENLEITSKTVNVTVPTNNNELTNGAGYQTAAQVTTAITGATKNFVTGTTVDSKITTALGSYATQSWVTTQLANVNKKAVVTATSQMTDTNTIYLLKHSGTEANNIYDEYIVYDGKPEKIGTTQTDLTGYIKSSELVAISNSEIDSICV